MRWLFALILTALAVACGPSSAARPAEVLVLAGATLIDGRGGPPRPGMTLVIREGRIADLYPAGSKPPPPGAEAVDLKGRWVMPGLIDTHVHLGTIDRPPEMVDAILKNVAMGGVTTIRDMGGNGKRVSSLSQRAREDALVSPRIVYSSLIIGPASDFWMRDDKGGFVAGAPELRGRTAWFRQVQGPGDAAGAVADAKAFGAGGLKLHSGLDRATVAALAAEARKVGLKVWGHAAIGPASPSEAVLAGVEVVSHGDIVMFEAVPGGAISTARAPPFGDQAEAAMTLAPVGGPAMDRLIAALVEARAMLEPNLFIVAGAVEGADGPALKARYEARLAYSIAFAQAARAAGVPLIAGTDAIGGSSPNLHAELQLLVYRVGLTPLEAITAATANAARALGLEREVGTVAVGMRADLLVLTADPAADIRNTLAIEGVVLGGRWLKRQAPMRTPPLARAPG